MSIAKLVASINRSDILPEKTIMCQDDQVCETLAERVPKNLDNLGLALVDVVKLSEDKRLALDNRFTVLLA